MIVPLKHNTHIVIKRDDADKYLSENQRAHLSTLCSVIAEGRLHDNKPINSYLVCNEDEPYAGMLQQLILYGELEKAGATRRMERIKPSYTIDPISVKHELEMTDKLRAILYGNYVCNINVKGEPDED